MKRRPTTPGEMLVEEYLKPAGITQVALAAKMGVPIQRVNGIISGRRAVRRRRRSCSLARSAPHPSRRPLRSAGVPAARPRPTPHGTSANASRSAFDQRAPPQLDFPEPRSPPGDRGFRVVRAGQHRFGDGGQMGSSIGR
jgi:hypothetical protein